MVEMKSEYLEMEVLENMDELKREFKEFINYSLENKIKKIVLFIKDEETILKIKKYIEYKTTEIELIGVTFPANEKMFELDENDELREFTPDAAKGNRVRNILKENNIQLVCGALPFEGIVIPGDNYNPYKIIDQTLYMVNPGLPTLVQTLLMATDNGAVLPGERVVVMNSKLAIEATGTNTRLLFHPKEGLKIAEIIQV